MTQTSRSEIKLEDVLVYAITDYPQKYVAISPIDSYDSAWINIEQVDAVIEALKEVKRFVSDSNGEEEGVVSR